MTDWESIADKYRRQRNGLSEKCRHLERRLWARSRRIGELKQMLDSNGIDWRAEDEKRRQCK